MTFGKYERAWIPIARTLFVTEGGMMILLHAFIKKQQKTPKPELDLAKERLKQLRRRK